MKANSSIIKAPIDLVRVINTNLSLIHSLTKREVIGKYKGSLIGVMWSFINPVLMLAVYTFVFSVVFKARWAGGSDSKTEFALVLFSGLLIFNLFSECITRAPSLIIGNVNYVKKVVFPIEILPIVTLCSALFQCFISFIVWLVFYLLFFGLPNLEILLLPLVMIPFILMVVGLSWILASLGVFMRDITQFIGIFVMVLMYLSPIFYPVSILPESYQFFMHISPLTFVVEQARDVMIWGKGMNWEYWSVYTLISSVVAWFGYYWFSFTKKGFADVI
ncbi:ABC transporter permease [Photobacterium sp. TY1-4]|uniref:ABC transporter permease n=1 Tax=Photobacterium sp. TY1-4 TaxID=2899122 RepID=UPI0021C11650|nr:ABC transporter permease [Photobacterium sp. TY1-4]UXI00544.1 ABC transporter permease [Photobacterium sp. TY1-4]